MRERGVISMRRAMGLGGLIACLLQTTSPELGAQPGPAAADPRLETVRRLALPLATIDPTAADMSDLEPLLDLIGDRRAVLLGEASHSSGSDFLAKTRIVRFLHERLGFDLLAFESPAWGMRLVMDSIRSGSLPVEAAFALGAFGHYAQPVQMGPLFAYLERTSSTARPLRVAGFDNQFLGRGQLSGFPEDLGRLLEARDLPSPLRVEGSLERGILESLSVVAFRRDEAPPPAPDERRRFLDALDAVRTAVASSDDDDSRWWSMVLEGTACHAQRVFALVDEEGEPPGPCARNAVMARHALWLLGEDPGTKIVFWAHNGHVMKAGDPTSAVPGFGDLVQGRLGDDAYTIITTSMEGTHGFVGAPAARIVEDQVAEVELEELLAETGWPAAIVPLRPREPSDAWLAQPFYARPIFYESESRPWARLGDAFLYIRTQEKARDDDGR